jgi:hypothetical protein
VSGVRRGSVLQQERQLTEHGRYGWRGHHGDVQLGVMVEAETLLYVISHRGEDTLAESIVAEGILEGDPHV